MRSIRGYLNANTDVTALLEDSQRKADVEAECEALTAKLSHVRFAFGVNAHSQWYFTEVISLSTSQLCKDFT